jgi:hypothetical protein
MSFLESFGKIDDRLHEYMQAVLFGWFGDYYSRVLLETQNTKMLSKHLRGLVFNGKFDELMRYGAGGKYNNLKGYAERLAFAEKLLSFARYQEIIGNGAYGFATRRGMDKIADKLTETTAALSELRKG